MEIIISDLDEWSLLFTLFKIYLVLVFWYIELVLTLLSVIIVSLILSFWLFLILKKNKFFSDIIFEFSFVSFIIPLNVFVLLIKVSFRPFWAFLFWISVIYVLLPFLIKWMLIYYWYNYYIFKPILYI